MSSESYSPSGELSPRYIMAGTLQGMFAADGQVEARACIAAL